MHINNKFLGMFLMGSVLLFQSCLFSAPRQFSEQSHPLSKKGRYSPLSDIRLIKSLMNREAEAPGFLPISFQQSLQYGEYDLEKIYDDKITHILEKKFNDFCMNFRGFLESSEYSIPPIIHVIWIGSPPPHGVQLVVESWKKHHPSWNVKLWTDEDMENFTWVFPRAKFCYESAKIWAEKADILRLEILYQYGGIYCDADQICLKPFDDLVINDLSFFAGILNENKSYKNYLVVANAVIGSKKSHPILKRIIELLKTFQEDPKAAIWERTGPGPCRTACFEALLQNEEEKIVLFPTTYFYPISPLMRESMKKLSFIEILDTIRPESFAVHIGEGSYYKAERKLTQNHK